MFYYFFGASTDLTEYTLCRIIVLLYTSPSKFALEAIYMFM